MDYEKVNWINFQTACDNRTWTGHSEAWATLRPGTLVCLFVCLFFSISTKQNAMYTILIYDKRHMHILLKILRIALESPKAYFQRGPWLPLTMLCHKTCNKDIHYTFIRFLQKIMRQTDAMKYNMFSIWIQIHFFEQTKP